MYLISRALSISTTRPAAISRRHPGKGIAKENFGELLKLAWDKSANLSNFTKRLKNVEYTHTTLTY
jgi:hypothetical protein